MTPLIALFARWGLPERFRRAAALLTTGLAAAVLCGLLWTCWLNKHDNAVIDKHEAKVTQAIATASASASAVATDAATETKNKVEQKNEQARKAASGSSDPLRDGLNGLRG